MNGVLQNNMVGIVLDYLDDRNFMLFAIDDKQAELLLEDEKTRKKTPQEKIELSNKKLA